MSQDSSQELEEDRVTWQSRHVEEVPTFALQDESQEEEELLPTQKQPTTAPPRRMARATLVSTCSPLARRAFVTTKPAAPCFTAATPAWTTSSAVSGATASSAAAAPDSETG